MENGVLGGFMSGLAGGVNTAMTLKKMQEPAPAVPSPQAPADKPAGFGLGSPLVSGEAGSTQIAGQQEDSGWGALKKIVASLEPSSQPASQQKTIGPYTQETPNG